MGERRGRSEKGKGPLWPVLFILKTGRGRGSGESDALCSSAGRLPFTLCAAVVLGDAVAGVTVAASGPGAPTAAGVGASARGKPAPVLVNMTNCGVQRNSVQNGVSVLHFALEGRTRGCATGTRSWNATRPHLVTKSRKHGGLRHSTAALIPRRKSAWAPPHRSMWGRCITEGPTDRIPE